MESISKVKRNERRSENDGDIVNEQPGVSNGVTKEKKKKSKLVPDSSGENTGEIGSEAAQDPAADTETLTENVEHSVPEALPKVSIEKTTAEEKYVKSKDKKRKKSKSTSEEREDSEKPVSSKEEKSSKKRKRENELQPDEKIVTKESKQSNDKGSEEKRMGDEDQIPKDIKMEDDVPFELFKFNWKKKPILPKGKRTIYARNLQNPGGYVHFIRNSIGRLINEKDIRHFFRKAGEIVNVEIKFRENGMPDYAKIKFDSHNVAKKALKYYYGRTLCGSPVVLDISREDSRKSEEDNRERRIIYFCGFGSAFDAYEVETKAKYLFSYCGKLMWVLVPFSKTDLAKGYGYAEFENEKGFSKALEFDGYDNFMGNVLQIRKAKVIIRDLFD